jgi:hypothetical protein
MIFIPHHNMLMLDKLQESDRSGFGSLTCWR